MPNIFLFIVLLVNMLVFVGILLSSQYFCMLYDTWLNSTLYEVEWSLTAALALNMYGQVWSMNDFFFYSLHDSHPEPYFV